MKISEIMTRDVLVLSSDQTIRDAARKWRRRMSALSLLPIAIVSSASLAGL